MDPWLEHQLRFFLVRSFFFLKKKREKIHLKIMWTKSDPIFIVLKSKTKQQQQQQQQHRKRFQAKRSRLWLYTLMLCLWTETLCVYMDRANRIYFESRGREREREKKTKNFFFRRLRCVAYGLVLPRTTAAFLSESAIRFLATFIEHNLLCVPIYFCVRRKWRRRRRKESCRYKRIRCCICFILCERRFTVVKWQEILCT